MKLKINGNYHELAFGIKFINGLDHYFGATAEVFNFGMGTLPAIYALNAYDIAALAKVISAAALDNLPIDIVYTYLEGLTDDELNKLFGEMTKNVNESRMVNFQLKKLDQNVPKPAKAKEPIKMKTTKTTKSK